MEINSVLLSGASGFLGKYIYNDLVRLVNISTISRTGADISVDLSRETPTLQKVDLVVHCAGKAHVVPRSEAEAKAFFDVNVNGTRNLLYGFEKINNFPKSFVFISTVAVYGCDTGSMINEDSALNATDPYGKSKIEAEKLVEEWCAKHQVICSILRLPLLAGTNPPGNLGAMINGLRKGYYFNIAGGKAKKSMVMADDVAKIIPIAAQVGGVYNLTDGIHTSFRELSIVISQQLGKNIPMSIPLRMAKLMAKIGDLLGNRSPINSNKLAKITHDLTFDDSKARKMLNWNPKPVLESFNIKDQT